MVVVVTSPGGPVVAVASPPALSTAMFSGGVLAGVIVLAINEAAANRATAASAGEVDRA